MERRRSILNQFRCALHVSSLRTVEDGNAFIKMLQAIVAADPDDYYGLVGKAYPDHFTVGNAGDRPMPGPDSEGPRP
ncbi:hypothetical protein AWB81_06691 [Caballeronia arationis]|jgi:hypothetical protein|uniref:Uncharacterized protein n=1 Tax=Caballeronia arationis TaxID=1777142 RepID=A0A7Z7N2S1_9BURK|nr:hypothetical protein AWB81_06691 [Caballeronia arationis]SOE66709.1 hypothetical protein SAMN05446927_3125 [Caballeronia arationis]